MTTLRQIVIDAFREGNITQVGVEPTAEVFDEGLRLLQRTIRSVLTGTLGELLSSASYGQEGVTNVYAQAGDIAIYVDTAYAPRGYRLVCNIGSEKTIPFPPNPQPGSRLGIIDSAGNFATYNVTLNGNGRRIEEQQSVVLNTNSVSREWFYRDDIGSWQRVTDLVAGDDSPFPLEFDDMLTTMLAVRISPRYSSAMTVETGAAMDDALAKFKARYAQTVPVPCDLGVMRLSHMAPRYLVNADRGATIGPGQPFIGDVGIDLSWWRYL